MKVVEIGEVKIGFLAVFFSAYKGVFDDVTQHDGLGCAYINDLRVNYVIVDAKKGVDYLIVLPHDGIEYVDIPMPETIARYRDFIEWGADAVIGTHPHCPQRCETYHRGVIFYSLGNFYFNSMSGYDCRAWNRPHWYEGLCVILSIDPTTKEFSYETINTRNVDNLGIVIENTPEREEHTKEIISYLRDREKYFEYLCTIFDSLGKEELSIIDNFFHPQTLRQCTKTLIRCWWKRFQNKDFANDYPLQRLLSHDQRRNLMMWTMK